MKRMNQQSGSKVITISTSTIFRVLIFTLAAFLALQLVVAVSYQLKLILTAFFLAMALNPAVSYLSGKLKSGSRVLSAGAAYLIIIVFLFGLLSVVVPPFIEQGRSFIENLPTTFDSFLEGDTAASRLARDLNLEGQIRDFRDDIASRSADIGGTALTAASQVGSVIASTVVVLVLAFMMLIEGPTWMRRLKSLQPKSKRAARERIVQKMYRVVTGYVYGQVLVAATGGIFSLIALLIGNAIFGASVNVLALAGIIFIFSLIPLIGTTIGGVIVVLTLLLSSLPFALSMGIFWIIYQQIENATLQPIIQSKTNRLTPLTVFVAALVGVGVAGFIGALAAIPIAGCIRVIFEEYTKHKLPDAEEVKN